jgi:hypothetical protein
MNRSNQGITGEFVEDGGPSEGGHTREIGGSDCRRTSGEGLNEPSPNVLGHILVAGFAVTRLHSADPQRCRD